MSRLFYFVFLIFLFDFIKSLELRMLPTNKLIYQNGSVDNLFVENKFKGRSNCTCDSTLIIDESTNKTQISINRDNATENFYLINVTSSNYLKVSVEHNLSPLINATHLEIIHRCERLDSDETNYFTFINIAFLNEKNSTTNLTFVKMCNRDISFTQKFLPKSLLIGFILFATYFVSEYNIDYTRRLQKLRSRLIFYLIMGSEIFLVVVTAQMASFSDKFIIMTFYIYLVAFLIGIYKYIKHSLPNIILNFVNRRIRDTKISRCLIVILSTIFFYSWYLSYYNWMLNNMFVFTIISYLVFIVKIDNFSPIIFFMISLIVTALIFTFFDVGNGINTINNLQFDVNYPVTLQIPKFFSDHPTCMCIYADYISIVLNAQFILYCKKIDRVLFTHKYYKHAFMFYLFYLIFLFLIDFFTFSNETIEQNLILFYPMAAASIIVVSLKNGDFRIFWRGRVLPGENLIVQNVIDIEIEDDDSELFIKNTT